MLLAPGVARNVPMSWQVEYGSEADAERAWTEARDEVGGPDSQMGDVVVAIATTFGERERVEFELADLWRATEEIYEDAGRGGELAWDKFQMAILAIARRGLLKATDAERASMVIIRRGKLSSAARKVAKAAAKAAERGAEAVDEGRGAGHASREAPGEGGSSAAHARIGDGARGGSGKGGPGAGYEGGKGGKRPSVMPPHQPGLEERPGIGRTGRYAEGGAASRSRSRGERDASNMIPR